jgi:hypothetical protein
VNVETDLKKIIGKALAKGTYSRQRSGRTEVVITHMQSERVKRTNGMQREAQRKRIIEDYSAIIKMFNK